ncbi:GHKL domain-containing protein [Enterococcus sp. AZ109]|uniref:GHKL domain-containing protein n=1 Tax=Enterococcus sp. AZ109 TaxID=2774634 RepID=UPI003F268018
MFTLKTLATILNNLVIIVPTYFFYQTVSCFAPVRNHLVLKLVVYFMLYGVMLTVIFPKDIVNVLGLLILFSLTVLLGFKGSYQRKLGAIFILLPLVISSNFVFEELGLRIFHLTSQTLLIDAGLHLFFNFLRIPLWYTVYHQFKKRITDAKKVLAPSMWSIINLVSLGPLVGIIFVVIFAPNNDGWQTFPAMLAIALTSIGIQYLTGYLTDSVKKDLENKNLRLQEDYYTQLEKNQLEVRKLKHDLNNHLSVVGNYLEGNQVDQAKEYFADLSTVYTGQTRAFCKNSLVNNVLNSKYQLALQNEIDCFFNIDISDWVGIDDISLCTIFANTLDNAIEAAVKIPEVAQRKLSVKARYHKGYFSYEIVNSTEERLVMNDGKILTTKPDKKNHGFGLANVREIVENYDGTLEITQTDDEFSLLVLIADV